MQDVEEVEFASLFQRFEEEYGDASERLVEQIRESYPEITRPSRRTGRALGNICFFIWCSVRDDDRNLIPALFRASVLLSAQDDYYDNPRIPAAQKETFCAAINHALRTNAAQPAFEQSLQLRELAALWFDVAGAISRSAPQLRSYWTEKACELNDAMATENRALRKATITYEGYMSTAIHSIGMVFVWTTYLALKHVPVTMLREMNPALLHGATVVRLSNDIASCRQDRNETNAVTLMRSTNPGVRVLRLVVQESRAFRQGVDALGLRPEIRCVLLRSMVFLREFYQRTDFDRRPDW